MIVLRSEREIGKMRVSGRIVAEIMDELREMIKPGVKTIDLDRSAAARTERAGAKSAFKGYRAGKAVFPATICASVDGEVVHGIPGERVLEEGEIVSIDIGVCYDGYYGDMAETVPVGGISDEKRGLIEAARESLCRAIEKARPVNHVGDISHAIESYVLERGFSVVRDFVGHGIGQQMHEEPQIPNYGRPGTGPKLNTGMVLAIEPMVNRGRSSVKVLEDGWTVVTADGQPSAHFEHTVAIGEEGPEILTCREKMQ